MQSQLRQISTSILVLGLLGCSSSKWTHSTLNESDFHKDRALCEEYAKVSNPDRTQQYNPYLNPNQQVNQSAANAGQQFGRAFGMQASFNNCMNAKGYRKE
jgi:hypothetical protein